MRLRITCLRIVNIIDPEITNNLDKHMRIGGTNDGLSGAVVLSFISNAIVFLMVNADVVYSHRTELQKF